MEKIRMVILIFSPVSAFECSLYIGSVLLLKFSLEIELDINLSLEKNQNIGPKFKLKFRKIIYLLLRLNQIIEKQKANDPQRSSEQLLLYNSISKCLI